MPSENKESVTSVRSKPKQEAQEHTPSEKPKKCFTEVLDNVEKKNNPLIDERRHFSKTPVLLH